jgi:superfamily II DNA or RNA helicase
MFQSNISIFYGQSDYDSRVTISNPIVMKLEKSKIELREYQSDAYDCCIRDLATHRSSLIVLATGLGKTILFSKVIESWIGRVLVLVEREELLQNAYSEIESITGEIVGIERAEDHYDGERVCVASVWTLDLRLERFRRDHFSLIIIDEAHHSASDIYLRILEHFESAKVIGLTATDARADGKRLPFAVCSYRMGIREGVETGYLVPIRGRRIIVDTIDLTRVKRKSGDGDFDDTALDDEMVKGAAAIADVVYNDHAFDKGILFFPGCASAKLTSEFLNKKSKDLSVYIDGNIKGNSRRELVSRLRNGQSNWLCNVGIATEGFNWPEAAVIGMCTPTLNPAAYVQRAGRGTRPLAGLLGGLSNSLSRQQTIAESGKPYMTILDFVGVSANLNLITHEALLSEPKLKEENVEKVKRIKEDPEEEDREEFDQGPNRFGRMSGIARGIQSKTLHSIETFDPVNDGSEFAEGSLKLVSNLHEEDKSLISEKQYAVLKKYGIDDKLMSRKKAGKLMGYCAQQGFRLGPQQKCILRKLYENSSDTDS